MLMRNKTAFGLLVLALVCGVLAGRGAAQTVGSGYTVLQSTCANPACSAVTWGQPPTDGSGNPLPAGANCMMGNPTVQFCVSNPTLSCPAISYAPNGCGGAYVVNGVYFGCYQAINLC